MPIPADGGDRLRIREGGGPWQVGRDQVLTEGKVPVWWRRGAEDGTLQYRVSKNA
ncbi:hypothetical protein [Methylosinus sp. PW1]|uniref:hypothetical protein n=1 Tax=Methylosinus sp. PW1 TaxID=107636 RepID=UPI0018DDEFBB|nr:hypothetical protein [Methylosinus sp. PW1]